MGEKRVVRGLRRKEGLRKFSFGSGLEEERGGYQRFVGRIVYGRSNFGRQEGLKMSLWRQLLIVWICLFVGRVIRSRWIGEGRSNLGS